MNPGDVLVWISIAWFSTVHGGAIWLFVLLMHDEPVESSYIIMGRGAIMVVGRDYFLRQAAALLEAAQLTGKSEAQELTLRALDLIALVDELSAPDDLNATAH